MPEPFKNYYGVELAKRLGGEIQAVYPAFDRPAFVAQIARQIEPLALKARVAVMSAALHDFLPPDYPAALEVLRQIMGPELASEHGMFDQGYHLMPIAHFVEVYGLNHYDESIAAIYEITKRFSGEFTIRPYLTQHQERTLDILRHWVADDNPHVRRLVSEGTRTRLPWASRLDVFIENPLPVLDLLAHLKADPSAYVRKSVANNLNDITKDHEALVLARVRDWYASGNEHTRWIIKHALRNLIKQGHPEALNLLGYGNPQVTLYDLTVTPQTIHLGDSVTLAFSLRSEASQPQQLIIDYVVHHVKANGQTSPKVFKLTTKTLAPGEPLLIQKTHAVKPITTRRYYPGEHRVEIQVNGQIVGAARFTLTV